MAQALVGAPPQLRTKLEYGFRHLTINPDGISMAWRDPQSEFGGCFFRVAHPDGNRQTHACFPLTPSSQHCGCLTQVRAGILEAYTDELTAAIKADERIPTHPDDIRVGDLPVLAEWVVKLAIKFDWED